MPAQVLRPVHVAFVLVLSFLLFPAARRYRHSILWWDWIAALAVVASIAYMINGGDDRFVGCGCVLLGHPGASFAANASTAAPARPWSQAQPRAYPSGACVLEPPQLIFTPFSAKYLIAPGWNGTGVAAAFWFSSLKLAASLCTAIRSSRFSIMVLTML